MVGALLTSSSTSLTQCTRNRCLPHLSADGILINSFRRDQDLGNTNYSVHTPRLSFDRAKSGAVPVNALRALQIPASLNDRHDVVVNGYKI